MDSDHTIAIVGMAGVFPGASSLEQFWRNIIDKVDTTRDIPSDRWIIPLDQAYCPEPLPDKAISRRACLINGFDPDLSGLSLDPDFVAALDPLYHLVLHAGRAAYHSCRATNIDPVRTGIVLAAIALPTDAASALSRAVFGHAIESEIFHSKSIPAPPLPPHVGHASRVTGFPAALLAQGLGLGGITYTLDAACASSLYAVKLACDELQSFKSDMMFAGGVSRPDCLYTQIGFSQLQALSPSGRCAPFDVTADGLVVGEGVGFVVLKRLADALRDNDTVHGIIRGVGLANDIGGNLLAPDSEGQVRAMQAAYAAAGWKPQDVDLIECHGAGTPVGDATELRSLSQLWPQTGWKAGQCGLGSVKSMIGHLLTGAGAAGLIKTLLALNNKTLPPSLKFSQAPATSPLQNGPWRVLAEPEEWPLPQAGRPRKAAVSAFGFGGINAHLLVEEWQPMSRRHAVGGTMTNTSRIRRSTDTGTARKRSFQKNAPSEIAVVGMGAHLGSFPTLRTFQEAIFNGSSTIGTRPAQRWYGTDTAAACFLNKENIPGSYIETLKVQVGEFHLPPNEIPDIIPQHLAMLQVAAQALADAGLPTRERRPRMGVVVGIDFDFAATNFSVRWDLYNKVQQWRDAYGLSDTEAQAWLEDLKASGGPALNSTRTLGALGGVIASRIAKELLLGGPSFVVSDTENSGLKALHIGVQALLQNETDCMLIGAVDFAGDVRRLIADQDVHPYSSDGAVRAFDERADGILPGDGAVAVVLKRRQQAQEDGDRIYAIIKGLGHAGPDSTKIGIADGQAYVRSLTKACADACVSPEMIDYIETHGSGDPSEDEQEAEALMRFWSTQSSSTRQNGLTALGSLKPTIGNVGAAAGLAAFVKASLCLYQEIIPPLLHFRSPRAGLFQKSLFHMPVKAQYWFRDRVKGPRRACVGAMTSEGGCSHIIIEGLEYDTDDALPLQVKQDRRKPLGDSRFGLFVVAGDLPDELRAGLDSLEQHLAHAQKSDTALEAAARDWHRGHPVSQRERLALAITLKDGAAYESALHDVRQALATHGHRSPDTLPFVSYAPSPLGPACGVAFVFPGSGNHYLGMGREIGIQWPEILRKLDFENQYLKSQHRPRFYIPQRAAWHPGWEAEAYDQIVSDPLNMIFGQVVHGAMMARVVELFGLAPDSVIGYSLGESAGLFASGAWSDRDAMLQRMLATDLFTSQLSGPCLAARRAWKIEPNEPFDWTVAVVQCSASAARRAIAQWPHVRLLIVNTPGECVLGGERRQVTAVIDALHTKAFFLDGVVTVHCDAALPVRDDYKNLHLFPVSPPPGVRFYSCAQARTYTVTSDAAAGSIEKQALQGFDFPAIIEQAYQDGVRIFLEMGPQASCTRMIHTILQDRPHLAVSACMRGENDYFTVLKLLGAMIAQRLPVDMNALYGPEAYPDALDTQNSKSVRPDRDKPTQTASRTIEIPVGRRRPAPRAPRPIQPGSGKPSGAEAPSQTSPAVPVHQAVVTASEAGTRRSSRMEHPPITAAREAMQALAAASEATSAAHQEYIQFSNELTRSIAEAFDLQNRLLENLMQRGGDDPEPSSGGFSQTTVPVFGRDMCMEFAVGSVGRVLGPEFDVVDTYKTRVRLPDEPLMLVDRILSIHGRKGSLGPGRIVTEHDVRPDAWYLDGGRAPVCISVEAGQADLFLSSYLGIDHVVKGQRTYRLLDATVEFHRGLPCPGDVLRYEINIEKFVRQGQTHLFFFNFKGFAGDAPLLRMTNGCAGFFTEEEVRNSGGIILTPEDRTSEPGDKPPDWQTLAPMDAVPYDDRAIEALRNGDLAEAFGPAFENKALAKGLRLPGGRMRLIDRILHLDPEGGRFGLGFVRAEADIHPDDWFLTCHFMDDMVMPGTLMYECCAHTLRVFIQRMGWITTKADVHYGPVPGVKSVLKCRGPVTPATRHVIYEVELKTIGYRPEPYVIADAHMFADGHRIVLFKDMSMQMNGVTRQDIESIWQEKQISDDYLDPKIFDRERLREFCRGKPSKAFGDRYTAFDRERFIARLPAPPYAFIDQVSSIEPPPWVLKPDGWIEAEFNVNSEAWYFKANRTPSLPYCAINEIALQACGWLAAYMGSALRSTQDLRFRNLGGAAVLRNDILPELTKLKTRVRLTQASEAGNMIIEHFDFTVSQEGRVVYEGKTHFGFFTADALAQQVGLRGAIFHQGAQDPSETKAIVNQPVRVTRPHTPEDQSLDPGPPAAMPAAALAMIDRIETYLPNGGPHGLGYIRGLKKVDPQAWFFEAHFYQDPVCPGSLGLESLLQLLKFDALERWGHLSARMRFGLLTDVEHDWMYRGQILPTNREITVEAVITEAGDDANPYLKADGLLHVDGLCIYKMQNFGIKMVPSDK